MQISRLAFWILAVVWFVIGFSIGNGEKNVTVKRVKKELRDEQRGYIIDLSRSKAREDSLLQVIHNADSRDTDILAAIKKLEKKIDKIPGRYDFTPPDSLLLMLEKRAKEYYKKRQRNTDNP